MIVAKVKYEMSINIDDEKPLQIDQCKSTHSLYTRFLITYITRLLLFLGLSVCYFLKLSSFFDIVQINITHQQTYEIESDLQIQVERDIPLPLSITCYVLLTAYQIYIIFKFNQIRQYIQSIINYYDVYIDYADKLKVNPMSSNNSLTYNFKFQVPTMLARNHSDNKLAELRRVSSSSNSKSDLSAFQGSVSNDIKSPKLETI